MSTYTSENYKRNEADRIKLGLLAIGGSVFFLALCTYLLVTSAGEVPMGIVLGFVFSKWWFTLLVAVAFAAPVIYAVGIWYEAGIIETGKVYLFLLAVVFWFAAIAYTAEYKSEGISDPNKRAQLNEYLQKKGQPLLQRY